MRPAGIPEPTATRREPADHEQQERHDRVDSRGGAEPEQPIGDAVLEDQDEHTVGGHDGQQVEQDRLRRDHDRAESDEHQPEREEEHEADDERQLRRHLILLVLPLGREPGDAGRHAGQGTDGLRHDVVPQDGERPLRRGVDAVALDRERDVGNGGVAVRLDGDRPVDTTRRERLPLEPRDRLPHRGSVHVLGPHDDVRRQRRARERLLHAVVRLHDRERLRERVRARSCHMELHRRDCKCDQHPTGEDSRQQWTAQHPIDNSAPHAALAVISTQPTNKRNVEPIDTVAQLGQHGRQDRQRSQHRHGDHDHGGESEGCEVSIAGQEHPRHRDHDRQT
jgi:hypothetical protein